MSKKSLHFKKTRGRGIYSRFHHCACLLYTENLASDWKFRLDNLGIPYCFCIHQGESEDLKEHVHLMLMFPTYRGESTIKKLLSSLGAEDKGEPYASQLQEIGDPVEMYEYLIHNTFDSRNKIQYLPSNRICGNGFDIENYISRYARRKLKTERFVDLVELIISNSNLTTLSDLLVYLKEKYPKEHVKLWDIVSSKTVFYKSLLDSNKFHRFNGEPPRINEKLEVGDLLGKE